MLRCVAKCSSSRIRSYQNATASKMTRNCAYFGLRVYPASRECNHFDQHSFLYPFDRGAPPPCSGTSAPLVFHFQDAQVNLLNLLCLLALMAWISTSLTLSTSRDLRCGPCSPTYGECTAPGVLNSSANCAWWG